MTVLEPVSQFLVDYTGKKVSLETVIKGAKRPRKPVLRVMDRLVREGCLEEVADNRAQLQYGEVGPRRRNPTWRILRKPVDVACLAPRRRTLRDRMWQIIRARRRFTRKELQRLACASVGSTEDFTKLLVRHGYLRVIGKDHKAYVFMLINDPGPRRPQLKEKAND